MAEKIGLVRKLNFWHIWAIGVGAVIGDGVFLLIGQGGHEGGPVATLSYTVAGVLVMVIMMAMTELAAGMPTAGSFHVWGRRILGPGHGYVAALCYVAMNLIFLGSVSIGIGVISNWWFQWTADPHISAIIWAIILLSIVVIVALSGVAVTGKTQLTLVGILLLIMIAFGIAGPASGQMHAAYYHPFMPYGFAGAFVALGVGTYIYMGPMTLLATGSECKKVTDLPKAMFFACLTFIVIYGICQTVLLGIVHHTELGVMESGFTVAAERIWGMAGGAVMNTAAWLAALTCLIGEVYVSSRLLYGMAKENGLPSPFAKVSTRTRVPWFAIVVAWVIGIVIVAIGNITALEGLYVELCMIGSEVGIVAWIIMLMAAIRYRAKFSEEWHRIPWHLPGRSVLIPLAFPCAAFILYGCFSCDPPSIGYTAIFIGVMVLLYFAYARKRLTPTEYL